MRYILDHTGFFDANPLMNIIPLAVMIFTLVYCITRIAKMKKQLREVKAEVSGELAQQALDKTKEAETHSLIDDILDKQN